MKFHYSLFLLSIVLLLSACSPHPAAGVWKTTEDNSYGITKLVLSLKVDKQSESNFKARGLEAFTYMKKGKVFKMSYYQAPEEVLEEVEEMNYWANLAYSAALRTASKKRK